MLFGREKKNDAASATSIKKQRLKEKGKKENIPKSESPEENIHRD